MSSEESPTDVVQRQLDAYNARDLERFLECFADDARYEALFAASPRLHSRLVHRI